MLENVICFPNYNKIESPNQSPNLRVGTLNIKYPYGFMIYNLFIGFVLGLVSGMAK
jgi:hypothetical protein